MTRKEFISNLGLFAASMKTSMDLALILSIECLVNFQETRNTGYLSEFLNAMPKNFSRRQAFLLWAVAFSPLAVKAGGDGVYHLSIDTVGEKDGSRKFDLEGAKAVPFWDYAPEPKEITFGPADVLKAIEVAIKKFGSKRYHGTEGAIETLEAARKAFNALAASITLTDSVEKVANTTHVPPAAPAVLQELAA